MPVEPPPSPWVLPDPGRAAPGDDMVAVGGDLSPGTLLAAYRSGLFPMPLAPPGSRDVIGWWSPDPRGILRLEDLRVSRSLRRSCRRFEVRLDTAFDEVVTACSEGRSDGDWITPAVKDAYVELHRLGWAHSVEAWSTEPTPELAGGLYGVAIGRLFAGESMFHRAADASKAALVGLVELLGQGDDVLLDVQWRTEHLGRLGVTEVPRRRYLTLVANAVARPLHQAFADH